MRWPIRIINDVYALITIYSPGCEVYTAILHQLYGRRYNIRAYYNNNNYNNKTTFICVPTRHWYNNYNDINITLIRATNRTSHSTERVRVSTVKYIRVYRSCRYVNVLLWLMLSGTQSFEIIANFSTFSSNTER